MPPAYLAQLIPAHCHVVVVAHCRSAVVYWGVFTSLHIQAYQVLLLKVLFFLFWEVEV